MSYDLQETFGWIENFILMFGLTELCSGRAGVRPVWVQYRCQLVYVHLKTRRQRLLVRLCCWSSLTRSAVVGLSSRQADSQPAFDTISYRLLCLLEDGCTPATRQKFIFVKIAKSQTVYRTVSTSRPRDNDFTPLAAHCLITLLIVAILMNVRNFRKSLHL